MIRARGQIEAWRAGYHRVPPHASLLGETPERFFELWRETKAVGQRRTTRFRHNPWY